MSNPHIKVKLYWLTSSNAIIPRYTSVNETTLSKVSSVWQKKSLLNFYLSRVNHHTILISTFIILLLLTEWTHGKKNTHRNRVFWICLNNNSIVNLLDCYALSSSHTKHMSVFIQRIFFSSCYWKRYVLNPTFAFILGKHMNDCENIFWRGWPVVIECYWRKPNEVVLNEVIKLNLCGMKWNRKYLWYLWDEGNNVKSLIHLACFDLKFIV